MKDKSVARVSFWQDLFQFGLYKRNQGRIVRQLTFLALAVTFGLAAWRLALVLHNDTGVLWRWLPYAAMEYLWYLVPLLLLAVGLAISWRLVANYPQFVDFLIAVEAEMNKVSWPSRTELIRSSLVVIFMMFFLAIVLFGFDLVWRALFQFLGVIQ